MSKKMKMTETSNCPLFNVKVTEDDSVLIGEERVWIWGFLAYLTKYTAWNKEGDISQALVEQARNKSMSSIPTLGMYKALKSMFWLQPHPPTQPEATPGSIPRLNKHEFWVKTLEDKLCSALLQSCTLDNFNAEVSLQDIMQTIHTGLLFTFSWNPILACAIIKQYNSALEKELSGDDFWTYNPVKLVQATLWCKDVRNEFQALIDKFHPTRLIPLGFSLLSHTLPMSELRQVSETSVSDQDRAIAVSTGLTQQPTSFASVLTSAYLTTAVLNEVASTYLSEGGHSNWASFYPSPDEEDLT
jgi:hypothetical protein